MIKKIIMSFTIVVYCIISMLSCVNEKYGEQIEQKVDEITAELKNDAKDYVDDIISENKEEITNMVTDTVIKVIGEQYTMPTNIVVGKTYNVKAVRTHDTDPLYQGLDEYAEYSFYYVVDEPLIKKGQTVTLVVDDLNTKNVNDDRVVNILLE